MKLLPLLGSLLVLSMIAPAQARWGTPTVSILVSSGDIGPQPRVKVRADRLFDRVVFTFEADTRYWGNRKLVFHGTEGTRRFEARYFLVKLGGSTPITRKMVSTRGFVAGRGDVRGLTIRLVVKTWTGTRWGSFYRRRFVVTAGPPEGSTQGATAIVWSN